MNLRELQENASEVIRRVGSGEHVTVTVGGRSVAVIAPTSARSWRSGSEIASAWAGGRYGKVGRGTFDDVGRISIVGSSSGACPPPGRGRRAPRRIRG